MRAALALFVTGAAAMAVPKEPALLPPFTTGTGADDRADRYKAFFFYLQEHLTPSSQRPQQLVRAQSFEIPPCSLDITCWRRAIDDLVHSVQHLADNPQSLGGGSFGIGERQRFASIDGAKPSGGLQGYLMGDGGGVFLDAKEFIRRLSAMPSLMSETVLTAEGGEEKVYDVLRAAAKQIPGRWILKTQSGLLAGPRMAQDAVAEVINGSTDMFGGLINVDTRTAATIGELLAVSMDGAVSQGTWTWSAGTTGSEPAPAARSSAEAAAMQGLQERMANAVKQQPVNVVPQPTQPMQAPSGQLEQRHTVGRPVFQVHADPLQLREAMP